MTVLVVSTDLDESPNGVTLSMWEDSVNDATTIKNSIKHLITFTRVDESQNFATQMNIDSLEHLFSLIHQDMRFIDRLAHLANTMNRLLWIRLKPIGIQPLRGILDDQ